MVKFRESEEAGYTVAVTIQAEKYVAKYNEDLTGHTLDGEESKIITLTYNSETKSWGTPSPASVTFNVRCETSGEIDPPTDGPSEAQIKELLLGEAVCVDCTTTNAGHEDKYYSYNGDFTSSIVDTKCMVTLTELDEQAYIEKYNIAYSGHEKSEYQKTSSIIELEKYGLKWVIKTPARIYVECKTGGEIIPPIDGPSEAQIKELLLGEAVCVECTTTTNHEDEYYPYNGDFTSSIVGTKCMVTLTELDEQAYIEQYNTAYSGHEKSEYQKTNSIIELENNGLKWVIKTPARIYVECKNGGEIIPPTDRPSEDVIKSLLSGKIKVECRTNAAAHSARKYGLLGGYTIEEVPDTGYMLSVGIEAGPYISKYSTDTACAHNLEAAQPSERALF